MQKVLIIGAGLVFAAGTALADDPNGTNGGSAAPAPSAGGVTAVEPAAADAWPGAVIDRPYALPAKGITAYGDVQILELSLPNPLTGSSISSTAEGLDIGGA
ncbi:MAG TPA: hypothetical protein VLX92_14085, partial [Kofleriaceae bacterium]|nr:hypothetical protein [Kofleriaceae bacterium]